MSMDVVDEVIDLDVLYTEPFEITYRGMNKHLPNFATIGESGSNVFLTITSDQDEHVEANHTNAPAGTKVTSSAIVLFNNTYCFSSDSLTVLIFNKAI
eukprot:scaffold36813_cov66-Attheya_sp.AAC.5